MKTIRIQAQRRQTLGKVATRNLRREGLAPGTLQTPNGPIHFMGAIKELDKVTHTPDTFLVELEIDGEVYKAVLGENQYHPVHGNLLTMDFQQVLDDKPVTVELPISLVGRSPGVAAGGKLVQKSRKLRVSGRYADLPERVEVDISSLSLGRSIKAGDLSYPDFAVRMNHDVAIASVEITRQLRQEASQQQGKK